MAASWSSVWPHLLWLSVVILVLVVLFCLVRFVYPKWIIRGFQRYFRWRNGFQLKRADISYSLTLTYVERGSVEDCVATLLIVHGFSTSKDAFTDVCKYLPRRYRVIAVDMPGHGGSSRNKNEKCDVESFARTIKKFVNAIGLNETKFHLYGYSLGGHVCGLYAAFFPDDLISLTLACPAGVEASDRPLIQREYEDNNKIILIPETPEGFIEMMGLLTVKDLKIPYVVACGVMQLRKEANWFYRQVIDGILDLNYRYLLDQHLHEITAPVFLMWGRKDQILSVECFDIISSKLPSPPKKTFIFDNCGHAFHLEEPELLMTQLTEYLDSFS